MSSHMHNHTVCPLVCPGGILKVVPALEDLGRHLCLSSAFSSALRIKAGAHTASLDQRLGQFRPTRPQMESNEYCGPGGEVVFGNLGG